MAEKVPGWLVRVLLPQISEVKEELKAMNARIDGEFKVVHSEIKRVEETLGTKIDELDKLMGRGRRTCPSIHLGRVCTSQDIKKHERRTDLPLESDREILEAHRLLGWRDVVSEACRALGLEHGLLSIREQPHREGQQIPQGARLAV